MAKIKSQNKGFTGIRAGVSFVKGEAETDDAWAIQWFENNGYEVEQTKPKAKTKPKEEDGEA